MRDFPNFVEGCDTNFHACEQSLQCHAYTTLKAIKNGYVFLIWPFNEHKNLHFDSE
jgi:hypothetical protein